VSDFFSVFGGVLGFAVGVGLLQLAGLFILDVLVVSFACCSRFLSD
jgi:hypothetical protein